MTVGNNAHLKRGQTKQFSATLQPLYLGIVGQFTFYLSVPIEGGYVIMHAIQRFASLDQVPVC